MRGILEGLDRAQTQAADLVTVQLQHGEPVTLKQNPTALKGSNIRVGACAWDGAYVLSAYLDAQPQGTFAGALHVYPHVNVCTCEVLYDDNSPLATCVSRCLYCTSRVLFGVLLKVIVLVEACRSACSVALCSMAALAVPVLAPPLVAVHVMQTWLPANRALLALAVLFSVHCKLFSFLKK